MATDRHQPPVTWGEGLAALVERGHTVTELALRAGVNESSIRRQIGGNQPKVGQVQRLLADLFKDGHTDSARLLAQTFLIGTGLQVSVAGAQGDLDADGDGDTDLDDVVAHALENMRAMTAFLQSLHEQPVKPSAEQIAKLVELCQEAGDSVRRVDAALHTATKPNARARTTRLMPTRSVGGSRWPS